MFEVIDLIGNTLGTFNTDTEAHDFADNWSNHTGNYCYVEVL